MMAVAVPGFVPQTGFGCALDGDGSVEHPLGGMQKCGPSGPLSSSTSGRASARNHGGP